MLVAAQFILHLNVVLRKFLYFSLPFAPKYLADGVKYGSDYHIEQSVPLYIKVRCLGGDSYLQKFPFEWLVGGVAFWKLALQPRDAVIDVLAYSLKRLFGVIYVEAFNLADFYHIYE